MSDNRVRPLAVVIDGLPQVVSGVYFSNGEHVELNVEGRGGSSLVTLVGNPVSLGALVAALADALDTAVGCPDETVVVRKDREWPVPGSEDG